MKQIYIYLNFLPISIFIYAIDKFKHTKFSSKHSKSIDTISFYLFAFSQSYCVIMTDFKGLVGNDVDDGENDNDIDDDDDDDDDNGDDDDEDYEDDDDDTDDEEQ